MDTVHFQKVYLPLQHKLYRFALRFVRDPMVAEDIVQEVFLRIWKKREELAGLEKPEAYCMTMTRNLSLNHLKGRDRQHADISEVLPPAGDLPSGDLAMEQQEKVRQVQAAIRTLSERQQLVVHLREVEDMTYEQISQILDISLAMVKSELFRARQHLKTKLQRHDPR